MTKIKHPQFLRIIESSESALRLSEAQAWVSRHLHHGAFIVSASRGAADDLARRVAFERGGAVGLHRFSFAQLAAYLAAPVLAMRGIAPATRIGSEAVAARATFEAAQARELDYFGPVAGTPGFPRALARTLHELSLAGVDAAALRRLPLGGRDLALLLERFDEQFAVAGATDRAALFEAATESDGFPRDLPLLMLDVPLESAIEFAFARRLIERASETLITVPFGDLATIERVQTLGVDIDVLAPEGACDLTALRRYLFATKQPPERKPTGEVQLFSAPGENRECVEIARRILEEARRGVRFDEMAVFVRSPRDYVGLLEDAFERAGIPAWFDRGTRRPHPSGRAFLAILSCAVERLSAVRFAEYLSLGQVPDAGDTASPPQSMNPADETLAAFSRVVAVGEEPIERDRVSRLDDSDDVPVVAGTLRAPWKWERLIVESAVIGGDPDRWRRRLNGLGAEYARQLAELESEDPDSPQIARLTRDTRNLAHLEQFALPIVEQLAAWPPAATWKAWRQHFRDLAPTVLRFPGRVVRILDELSALDAIGPVPLEEARDVLAERLRSQEEHPTWQRYGRVFVGSPHQGRGRAFKIVFVPALAERLFPQKPREDPMLLDEELRTPLAAGLVVQEDRAKTERLLLRLAVGAATERLWLSYPRVEVSGARPRVPSFYVLDVMRAVTGRIPNHEVLQRQAAAAGGAKLDWPAPQRPADSIDEVEHDLATLRELMTAPYPAEVRGHAHYLLRLNDPLRRSVSRRWARARGRWRAEDGLVRVNDRTRPMLDLQRMQARAYSVSALQKFTTCPYQFVLSAIYRMEPSKRPEPLQRLDPLTRGSIFHEVQELFFKTLHQDGRLPVRASDIPGALKVLETIVAAVSARRREELAPAIDRVWSDEIDSIARDLRMWVRKLPEAAEWTPRHFELSFGLDTDGRDPSSVREAVIIDGRFKLRGSVDLVEERERTKELRITDHKTGRNRTTPRTVIGGGAMLQPVVYALVVEKMLARPVVGGRLFYCTAAGGFTDHPVPLTEQSRRSGLEALEIIDRAIELGFLPPAPAERACTWCDFRPVCGPDEPAHLKRKPSEPLGDLQALRALP
ncbi:MAG: PD-(D/E)XK nuclease family protein [Vicinamibacterales bacterium]